MSAEEFDCVKSRAVRLDRDVGGKEGSGLGLSIAHTLAESRGYSLTLDRNRRTGAGIILSIPMAREERKALDGEQGRVAAMAS